MWISTNPWASINVFHEIVYKYQRPFYKKLDLLAFVNQLHDCLISCLSSQLIELFVHQPELYKIRNSFENKIVFLLPSQVSLHLLIELVNEHTTNKFYFFKNQDLPKKTRNKQHKENEATYLHMQYNIMLRTQFYFNRGLSNPSFNINDIFLGDA